MADPGLLSIGEAAIMLNVSQATLRLWEKAGLIEASRTAGGQRRYTRQEISRCAGRDDWPTVEDSSVVQQLHAIKEQSGELYHLHYSDRITDPEVREFLVQSIDNPDQLSMRHSIGIADAVLSIHAKRFSEMSSESEVAWKKAKIAFNRLREAQRDRDAVVVSDSLNELQKIFNDKNWWDHESQIQQWQEHRARLVRTEVERLSKGGEYITAEDAIRMSAQKLQAVLAVVRQHCSPEVQKEIIEAARK